ncbi:PaaI family thioesterase [Demequina sp.]|uniref:PaaI family thioesterase n=1 Tax=Demequina sp. TaxID=2050685 RepID=UPI003D12E2CD
MTDEAALQFPGTLIERLGIEIISVAPDTVVATMPVAGNTQPYGLLHGGASAALAETVGSLGAMAHAGPGNIAVGVDLNITHHRAVTNDFVTATATSVHRGRTIATYDITITDTQQRRVATARLTCLLKTQP